MMKHRNFRLGFKAKTPVRTGVISKGLIYEEWDRRKEALVGLQKLLQ